MVLICRALVVGALCAFAACSQSPFDSHGDPPGTTDGGGNHADSGPAAGTPLTCPAPCLADAAGDFDGSARGTGMRWRYLDDHRDRTWAAMTAGATQQGGDPAVHIAACAAHPASPACVGLPGALLLSSGGKPSAVEPAIELTHPSAQVIKLTLAAYTESTGQPIVRLYRNSREDLVYAAPLTGGAVLFQPVTLDALAGDRFLVSIGGDAAADVAVHLFASGTEVAFPSSCQLALQFGGASGNTVDNLCGDDLTHEREGDTPTPPVAATGPYAELAHATDLTPDYFFVSAKAMLDLSPDVTVQLWVKQRGFVDDYSSWPLSTLDLNATGGLGIEINQVNKYLDISTCTSAATGNLKFADALTPYPDDGLWHFIRVTHRGPTVYVCIDGTRRTTMDVPAGKLATTIPTYIGRNAFWSPQGAFTDAQLADIRVLSTALPCD